MSRKHIRLRTLTDEKETEIRRLAASRKEPIRLAQRARVIAAMLDDPELTASQASLQAGFGSELIRHRGEVYAIGARCPHTGAPLKNGWIADDGSIVGPLHRSAFDLRTGDVKEWTPWPPAVGKVLGAIRRERALPVYPVRIEDGRIWVGIE